MKVGFLYPDMGIGGAQLLFARLLSFFSKYYPFIDLYYIDYEDGYAVNYLKSRNIKFTHLVYDIKGKTTLPENLLIIAPFDYHTFNIIKKSIVKNNTRFLFWFIHPYLLLAFFHSARVNKILGPYLTKKVVQLVFPFRFSLATRLLVNSNSKNGLIFMDGENIKMPSYLIPQLRHFDLVPIPIDIPKDLKIKTFSTNKESINIGILGRVADTKVGSILTVINDIVNVKGKFDRKIHLDIIGGGPKLEYLKAHPLLNNIDVEFHGMVDGNELNQLLINKIDILFSMGTSALEGASRGVPTILIDIVDFRPNKQYLYNWLSRTKEYCLGSDGQNVDNCLSFMDILTAISLEKSYNAISVECYEYAQKHSIDKVAKILYDICTENTNVLNESDFKA